MRDALGMNEFTKKSIEDNIESFCEMINQSIESNAKKGYFEYRNSFDISNIPKTLEGEPCIFIAKDRLQKLGYDVIILETDSSPHRYRITVCWSDSEVFKNV
jgi:hypothetical protein